MTLANSSATIGTPGDVIATHTVSGVEYQVVMPADDSGHLLTTKPTYTLWVPGVTASTSRLHFDLFNGTSASLMEILGVWAIPKSDVAVTGVIAVPMGLFRTSAVGGTATATAGYNTGTVLTSPVITPLDTNNANAVTAGVSARSIPTTGATISAPWWENYIFTEETNAATYMSAYTNLLPMIPGSQPWTLRAGQGMVAKQGATGSTIGTIAWLVLFKVF